MVDPPYVIPEDNLCYGLEGIFPSSTLINEMRLYWDGKLIKQDQKFYDDLFNIHFEEGIYSSKESNKFSIHSRDQTFFFKQSCGDGAGFYEITWVIENGILIQRLIDEI